MNTVQFIGATINYYSEISYRSTSGYKTSHLLYCRHRSTSYRSCSAVPLRKKSSKMPDSFNNIFMTTENLAFSLPLIFVCVAYVSSRKKSRRCRRYIRLKDAGVALYFTAGTFRMTLFLHVHHHPSHIILMLQVYFKYVPVHIALPLLGGIFVIAQIRSQFKKRALQLPAWMDGGTPGAI